MTDMIGFIGVGTMGEPMCRNLARKSGATVLAADRNPEPLQRLAADGVKTASLDEIVAQLPDDLPVAAGRQGSRAGLPGRRRPRLQGELGWTIIDTSTAPVSLARRLYAEFEGKACGLRRRADRAHAPGRDRRHAVDHGRRHAGTFARIEPLLRHLRERGHALRRGGRAGRRSRS